MHAITVSISINDGHQEIIAQIQQLLESRGITVCYRCDTSVSTSIIAQRDSMELGLNNMEIDTSIPALEIPDNGASSGQQTAPPMNQDSSVNSPVAPECCRIMQLSTDQEVPFITDPSIKHSTLCVQGLSHNRHDQGMDNAMAFFTYCGQSYKVPITAFMNANTYTNELFMKCTVSFGDSITRIDVLLKDSDACCLIAGTDLLNKLNQA